MKTTTLPKAGVAAAALAALGGAAFPHTAGAEPTNTDKPATPAQKSSRGPDDPKRVNATSSAKGFTTSSFADCSVGYACGWVDTNYTNARGQWGGNNSNWGAFSQPNCQNGTWKNCASSARNNGTQCSVTFYRNLNYVPGGTIFFLGDSSSNLNNQAANDDYESNAWC